MSCFRVESSLSTISQVWSHQIRRRWCRSLSGRQVNLVLRHERYVYNMLVSSTLLPLIWQPKLLSIRLVYSSSPSNPLLVPLACSPPASSSADVCSTATGPRPPFSDFRSLSRSPCLSDSCTKYSSLRDCSAGESKLEE